MKILSTCFSHFGSCFSRVKELSMHLLALDWLWCSFIKMYYYIKVLCSLAGGIGMNKFMKWIWEFMKAIVLLKPETVSPTCRAHFNCLRNSNTRSLTFFWSSIFISVDGINFQSPTMVGALLPTNSRERQPCTLHSQWWHCVHKQSIREWRMCGRLLRYSGMLFSGSLHKLSK